METHIKVMDLHLKVFHAFHDFPFIVWFSLFCAGFQILVISVVNHKDCHVNKVNSGSSSTDLETLFFLWLNAQVSPVKEALSLASS